MYNSNRHSDFFWGALVGGAVATLSTLLFTTKTGAKVQGKIADAYKQLENGLSDTKEKVEETAHDVAKKATSKAKKENE